MGYYGSTPETDHLEYVDSFEKEEACYSFNTFQVMFDPDTEKYHVGEDSGCSCPSPFEDFHTLADWGKPLAAKEVVTEIRETHVSASELDDKLATIDAVEKHARERGIW